MSHDLIGLTLVALCIGLYAVASRVLDRVWISGPMVFAAAGVLLGPHGLGVVDVHLESGLIRLLVEATLALVLFTDASRIDLPGLRQHLALPARLLGIGLPLTLAAGLGGAALAFPAASLLTIALVTVILTPTDASLGAPVTANPRVPDWVRQGLNVESGLNDGLLVPIFTLLVAAAIEVEHASSGNSVIGEFVQQVGVGTVAGVTVGLVGGRALRTAARRGWMEHGWTGIATVLVVVCSYTASVSLGGSGFISAFVAGAAFGHLTRGELPAATELAEENGQLLSAVAFFVFGATLLSRAIWSPMGAAVAYGVASLTVVRMIPVALSLQGSGANIRTKLFCGWFGPRGLASILFLILLVEDAPRFSGLPVVVQAVTWTVGLSILLHGISATPLAERYADWFERNTHGSEHSQEAQGAHPHVLRRSARRAASDAD